MRRRTFSDDDTSCAARLADVGEDLVGGLADHRGQQVLLGLDVVVEAALVHPHLAGDVLERRGDEALLAEQRRGRIDDLVPPRRPRHGSTLPLHPTVRVPHGRTVGGLSLAGRMRPRRDTDGACRTTTPTDTTSSTGRRRRPTSPRGTACGRAPTATWSRGSASGPARTSPTSVPGPAASPPRSPSGWGAGGQVTLIDGDERLLDVARANLPPALDVRTVHADLEGAPLGAQLTDRFDARPRRQRDPPHRRPAAHGRRPRPIAPPRRSPRARRGRAHPALSPP